MMKALWAALALSLLSVGPATGPVCAAGGCCKMCSKGKACGDSCIAADKTCHKGSGCACDS